MWDLRKVHALHDGWGWVWNESFHHKNVFVDEKRGPERNLLAGMSDVLSAGLLK